MLLNESAAGGYGRTACGRGASFLHELVRVLPPASFEADG